MNCINTKSKEFKELERATKLSPFELERVIMVYQSQTGKDDFPSEAYIRAKTSRTVKGAIEKLEKNISDKQGLIEESNLDINYIASITDNVNQSAHIEKHIREVVIELASKNGIETKFVHDTSSIDKLRVVNGKLIVNLSAIHEKDSSDTVFAALYLMNATIPTEAELSTKGNQRIINELQVLDSNGEIKIIDAEDIGDIKIIKTSTGSYRLVEKTIDAENNLNRNDVSVDDMVLNLEPHSVKILPTMELKSILDTADFTNGVLTYSSNIKGEQTDKGKYLEYLVDMLEQDRKGIYNINGNEVKTQALNKVKQQLKDLNLNDSTPFSSSVEYSDTIQTYPLQGFVFKTEIERSLFIESLLEIDPVSYELAKKDPNSLSKQELKRLRSVLSQLHRNSVNQLKKKIKLTGNITDSNFKKTELSRKLNSVIDRLSKSQSTSRTKSEQRKLNVIASPTMSNTEVYSSLKKSLDNQTETLTAQITTILSEIDKAIIDNDQSKIEGLTNDLERTLSIYKSVAGANYDSPSKGVNSPATIKIFNEINKDTITEKKSNRKVVEESTEAINTDEDGNDIFDEYDTFSVPTIYADQKTNISKNIAQDQDTYLARYGEEYSGIYGSFRNVKDYRNARLRQSDIQKRIDAISKKLDAKIVLDPNLPGKAALLSDYSQHVINARRGGHTGAVIALNPEFLTSDTIFHEFGHLYIELLGTKDNLVDRGIQLLRGTQLYYQVQKEYPELNEAELDKEVLATALGMEADMIFQRSLQKLTFWQAVKKGIMDFLYNIFKLNYDALEQLAKEMLNDKRTRVLNTDNYSSHITHFSKYKIDSSANAQTEAARLFNELRNDVILNEENHKYNANGEEMIRSITAIAQSMAGKQKAGPDKGSFSMEFNKDDYSKESILYALNKPEIPAPLAHALNNMINSRIDDVTPTAKIRVGDNWFSVYAREMAEEAGMKETPEEKANREKLRQENPELFKSIRSDIENNFDAIINEADRLAKTYASASVMGNILHKAAEKFILEEAKNSPSGNIINSEVFFEKIKEIYDNGVANGSLFFSEQVLFDEDTKSPGTADFIEITKDGTFKIYDFKTVKSFRSKDGNDLSPNSLYYKKGYVHQLLSYGEILKKYGLKPHEDPYHIIITEVSSADPDVIVKDENDSIKLGNTRVTSIKNIPFYDSKFKQTQVSVNKYFKNKKVSRIDLKSQIENLEDATNQMYNVMKKFNTTLQSKASDLEINFNSDNIIKIFEENADKEAMKDYSEEVKYKYKRYITAKNSVVINTFLDNIHRVMGEIKDFYNDGDAETSAQQLRSLNYILQVGESLADIRRGLTPQELRKNDTFTEEEAQLIEEKIIETMDAIKTNRDFYKRKVIENAIHTLAMNSKQQEGFEIEVLEMKARRSGKTSRDEITKYVQENIKDAKDKLESQELAYWTSKYESGILDLRTIESMFADPGMINSQIIQTAKQIMDSNDLYVRKLMMDYGPEIEAWHDKLNLGSGNTRKRWGKFLTKSSVYIAETDKMELIEDGGIIPEFVSNYYIDTLKNENDIANINRKKMALINKDGMTKSTVEQLEKYNEEIDTIKKSIGIKLQAMTKKSQIKDYYEAKVNPQFKALSESDQEALRYIHKQLTDADGRIDNKAKRLTRSLKNNVVIYRLPRKRMSMHEIGVGNAASAFISQVKDVWRPPADEDADNIREAELNPNDSGTAITDIKGNQVLDVPVYYRNQLEDPRLQSFDIPTLLLENHLTTLTYQQATEMEADLFILKESISSENNDKIMRTDNLMKQTMTDVSKNFSQKSEDNNLYKALTSSIDQRLYKRAFSGVYSKGNYRLIKTMSSAAKFATINALTMNFKSMATTSLQGSVYRLIEGYAGEHFNMNDWKEGTTKTFGEFGELIKDTQRHVHQSKTNLLMKLFGLEQRSTALANKFVQDSIASKNLDSDSLYAVTSIAETTVSSMLMYSMLSNVKVMDKEQNYIDKDGKIVTDPKDAMSLDEAYEVKDGKLVLNPKVIYTNKDFINPLVSNGNLDNDVASRIGSNMQNVYANMYGQYNEHLKSRVQRTAIGKMVMSMKGWLPRGLHNRFRGITTAIPFTESRLSFEDLRNPESIDKRFFSQSSKTFHEGYHATTLRFITDVALNMKNGVDKLAFDNVYNNMTTHERANIKRSLIELALIASTFIAYKFLAALAKSYEEDDERASEYFYFVTYMTFRLNDELSTFISPFAMAEMIKNPAVAIGTVTNISKLLSRLFGYDFDIEEGFEWDINDRYETGPNKGNLKVTKDVLRLTPGVNNTLQIMSLFGVDTGKTMKEQFNNQMMASN